MALVVRRDGFASVDVWDGWSLDAGGLISGGLLCFCLFFSDKIAVTLRKAALGEASQ